MPVTKGLLSRRVPVELVDLSLSGCLLRSHEELPRGAMGQLTVHLGGETYEDTVFVTRTQSRPGAGPCCDLGGEFVWGTMPERRPPGSARSIVPDR